MFTTSIIFADEADDELVFIAYRDNILFIGKHIGCNCMQCMAMWFVVGVCRPQTGSTALVIAHEFVLKLMIEF